MAIRHMKRCSTLLTTREIKNATQNHNEILPHSVRMSVAVFFQKHCVLGCVPVENLSGMLKKRPTSWRCGSLAQNQDLGALNSICDI